MDPMKIRFRFNLALLKQIMKAYDPVNIFH